CVRAEEPGEVTLDVAQLRDEAEQEIDQPRWFVRRVLGGEELHRPDPRDGPKRELQCACPVEALPGRVPPQPSLGLADHACTESPVSGEPPRPAKADPVLMSIELP